jgi:hypothetical protein
LVRPRTKGLDYDYDYDYDYDCEDEFVVQTVG